MVSAATIYLVMPTTFPLFFAQLHIIKIFYLHFNLLIQSNKSTFLLVELNCSLLVYGDKQFIGLDSQQRPSLNNTMGIFERNEYIPHGNELVPYEITFMRIGNEFIPTLCWNLHKPKPPKIKTFLMEKVS